MLFRCIQFTEAYLHPAELARARATLAAAQQALTIQKDQAEACDVRAPGDGTVLYLPVQVGADPNTIPENEEMVTQIIPVRYISATPLARDLQALLPGQATLTANEGGNALILTDTQARLLGGVLRGQRYSQLAQQYNQSEGHLKGVAADLWKQLSQACGEPIRKPNLRSYLQRQGLLTETEL